MTADTAAQYFAEACIYHNHTATGPVCVAAFIDYQLKGKSLSRMEVDIIQNLYKMLLTTNQDFEIDLTIESTMKEAGAGKREIREFIDTLKER